MRVVAGMGRILVPNVTLFVTEEFMIERCSSVAG
jgi:hypothetical protein